MATIAPLTGQTTNTTKNQRADLPATDNIPKSRSAETITPKQNAVDTVQKRELNQSTSTPAGKEKNGKNNHNTPEQNSTFIAKA